jgi:hypothetical protein
MDKLQQRVKCLQSLKENLIKFIDELMMLLPKEKDLLLLRTLFMDFPMEEAMNIMIDRVVPYEDIIVNKNDKFFLECTDIFEGIGDHKVSYFKELWQSQQLCDDDKEAIWVWFQYFLKLGKKYKSI